MKTVKTSTLLRNSTGRAKGELGEEWVRGDRDSERSSHDEPWVMYTIVGSLYCVPETNKHCVLTALKFKLKT